MRKILLYFITISLVLITSATRTPLYAAGSDSSGYIATNGENIIINNRDVLPIGLDYALRANLGGTITVNGGTLSTSASAHHVAVTVGGTITLNDVGIKVNLPDTIALYLNKGFMTMNGGTIYIEGNISYGAAAFDGSLILNDVGVETHGRESSGLVAYDDSDLTINGSSITTYGFGSHALVAYDKSSDITMTGGSITTYDTDSGGLTPLTYGSYGAYARNAGARITLNNVDVATYGATGGGSYGLGATSGGSISMNGGSVYTEGRYSHGLAIVVGKIDVSDATIETKANDTYGVYTYSYGSVSTLKNTAVTTSGNNAAGLLAWAGAEIYMNGGSVATSGSTAYGAWCRANSQIYLQNVEIRTTGSLGDAVQVRDGGYLSMDAPVISASGADAYAIRAYGTGGTLSKVYGDASVFTIGGNIAAQDYSLIDLKMNDGSTLTGWTELGATDADLLMAITGANSVWNVTGDSKLTDLTLIDSLVNYQSAALGTTITVTNLNSATGSDGGYLRMKTDIVNENADLLKVTGTTGGDHTIRVINVGSAATDGSEVTLLVDAADQDGNFSLYGNGVSLGGWYYELRQNTADYGNGAGWELYATGSSPSGDGGVNTFIANYLLGYAETQTLLQRLGDLRDTPQQSGLWFRLHGGKFVSNAKSYVNSLDLKYYGVQVGYDRKVAIDWEGDSYLGVMFGYSDSDLDYLNNGSGSVDSKTIALYWTSIKPGGFYLDAVLKYVWMHNDYSVLDSAGAIERGNGVNTHGFGASLEFGERWHFDRNIRKGLYIEPQVQLSYQRQSGGQFTTSGGLEIGVRPYNSLIGRLGILIGYDNLDSNFYLKVSKEKEFLGDLTVVANGVEFTEKMKGSWWAYGLGYTAKINERNSFYLDLERTSGGHFTKEWAAKAGWRTMF